MEGGRKGGGESGGGGGGGERESRGQSCATPLPSFDHKLMYCRLMLYRDEC